VEAPRETLLDDLHDHRRIADFWFGKQQMKVFGHDDVSVHDEMIFAAGFFENRQKQVASFSRIRRAWRR